MLFSSISFFTLETKAPLTSSEFLMSSKTLNVASSIFVKSPLDAATDIALGVPITKPPTSSCAPAFKTCIKPSVNVSGVVNISFSFTAL